MLVAVECSDLKQTEHGLALDPSDGKLAFLQDVPASSKLFFVFTKKDLLQNLPESNPLLPPNHAFFSAVTDKCTARIEEFIESSLPRLQSDWLGDRQIHELNRILEGLSTFLSTQPDHFLDLRSDGLLKSLDAMGRLTGLVRDEEILDKVFSKFCVGK